MSVTSLALSPGGGGHNESQIWKCFIPLPRGNMWTILLIPLFFLPGMLLMKLFYSSTFYRNVYSAKMTSFEKTNTNSARAPPKVSWITIIQPNLENKGIPVAAQIAQLNSIINYTVKCS